MRVLYALVCFLAFMFFIQKKEIGCSLLDKSLKYQEIIDANWIQLMFMRFLLRYGNLLFLFLIDISKLHYHLEISHKYFSKLVIDARRFPY